VLRDDAGRVLRVSLGEGDVDCRPYYEADPEDWIVKALVAVEDGSFWTHCGVRPLSILRAAVQNLFYGRRISGASTITMQAVRLIRPHPKTLWWKWKEAVLALKMERAKDKRWILSQYLNRAPYGSNFVGIEAAAHGWFGKGAKDLGLSEAAVLAGMVQAPSRFRPDRGYARALRRRDYVLDRMLTLGLITEEQAAGAKAVRPAVCRSPRPFTCPYFCDWAMQQIGRTSSRQRQSGDYVTTLNADVQRLAEDAVARAARDGGYAAAAVVLRTDSGAVQALACSGDYFDPTDGQVNTALAARPAGSTLKPFLVALAMDRGQVTPEERLADVPQTYKGYRPANFDADYRGLVTARDALVLSLNLPFVRLLQRVGVPAFGETLRNLGFGIRRCDDESFGLGMAIGNVEVSLLELAAAYATVARGGVRTIPVALASQARTDGSSANIRVFSSGASYLVSDMLSGSERAQAAFGHIADVGLPRFAWKTGTSSAYRDAWTVAWNPEYVIGVWCGHKRGGFGDKSVVGAKAAAPVVFGLVRALYPQNGGPWFVEPDEVERRSVCALTGQPAAACCPRTEVGRSLKGVSSNRPCGVHVRGADGTVQVRHDPAVAAFLGQPSVGRLRIVRPEDGTTFRLVPDMKQQKVVCRVVGNAETGRLWWFVDGVSVGETRGTQPFALDMSEGHHEVVCTTAEGTCAAVRFAVKAGLTNLKLSPAPE